MLDASKLSLAKRTVEVRGVELPFTIPAIKSEFYPRDERSGVVFVPFSVLEELDETEPWGAHLLAGVEIEQALIDAGWANKSTGGSLFRTEAWDKKKVLSSLYDLLDY